ncbi:PH domain-containing protein [bacterium]|nr:PH domain-containing protein [bacterium]
MHPSPLRHARLVHRIKRSALGPFGLLDLSGGYKTVTSIVSMPWTGLCIGVLLAVLSFAVLPSNLPYLAFAVGLVLIAPCFTQMLIAADFVTDTAIVCRRGVFIPRYTVTPLPTIIRVEYQYPRFGEAFGVGDLFIQASGATLEFLSIKHPERTAHLIQRLCERPNPEPPIPGAV